MTKGARERHFLRQVKLNNSYRVQSLCSGPGFAAGSFGTVPYCQRRLTANDRPTGRYAACFIAGIQRSHSGHAHGLRGVAGAADGGRGINSGGTVWFLTSRRSAKVDELEHNGRVGVTMQSRMKFVSLSGTCRPVEDRALVARLWKVEWKTWFPGGRDDPDIVLLCVYCDAGEYWDSSGTAGLKYLFEAGKAIFTGTRARDEGDPKVHARVSL
jgi:general stress protein 26